MSGRAERIEAIMPHVRALAASMRNKARPDEVNRIAEGLIERLAATPVAADQWTAVATLLANMLSQIPAGERDVFAGAVMLLCEAIVQHPLNRLAAEPPAGRA